MIFNLRQSDTESEKMSEEGSDISHLSSETRISMNVQQVNSRYHGVQATIKVLHVASYICIRIVMAYCAVYMYSIYRICVMEPFLFQDILKKCQQAVSAQQDYDGKYRSYTELLAKLEDQYKANCGGLGGDRDTVLACLAKTTEALSGERHQTLMQLNATVEAGELLAASTAQEGRDATRVQMQDVQHATDELYEKLARLDRELRQKLNRWEGYEESSSEFAKWLQKTEDALKGEIELRTTLDEKKGQLQVYRALLQDIKGHKPVLDDLAEKATELPERSAQMDNFVAQASQRHAALLAKALNHVERYEAIVSDHHQYTKAVMEASEWLNATLNTIDMWGDTSLERLSLHANLERLKSLQLTLPEEEYRCDAVRTLGERVIPGTVDSGQVNIRAQIDASAQEWLGLVSTVQSYAEGLEAKIRQWADFESMRDECLAWLRDADTMLHTCDMRPNLTGKCEQLEELKNLQSQVKAKELEIDVVTERSQQLSQGVLQGGGIRGRSNGQLTELAVKYQQVTLKVKDLVSKWQQLVKTHTDYEAALSECQQWIADRSSDLNHVSQMGMSSQADVDAKVRAVSDLVTRKDEGFAKVQATIELAQVVLADTSTSGHGQIKVETARLQSDWGNLAARLAELKLSLEDSIRKWSGFLEQLSSFGKMLEAAEKTFKDTNDADLDTRTRMENFRALDEKIRCEKLEADQLRAVTKEIIADGYHNQSTQDGLQLSDRFEKLSQAVKGKLSDCENQHRDFKAFRSAQESLAHYLQRCKDKLHTMRQRSPNDKNYVEAVIQALDHLLNKEAQGQILLEQVQQAGDVLLKNLPASSHSVIKEEVAARVRDFEELFGDIKQQRDQMGSIMNVFRDFKEETERLSDWMQQADINVKAAKTSLLATLAEKERAVRDVKELNKKLIKGQKDLENYNTMAAKMKNSCLEANVTAQQREIVARYETTCKLSTDVLNKITNIYDQHYEFDVNLNAARDWIDIAWSKVRANTSTEGKSREELHSQLDQIRQIIQNQEEGQRYVHEAIDWGEKALRNTRSDGRDKIQQAMKELQADWDKLAKKMSTAKVSVETDLLQWSDTQQSVSRLQEWIDERENRLKQASQIRHVMITRRSTLGISTLSVSERTAALRRTNSILQDIQAFEPMIQSVAAASSESTLSTASAPVTEITEKYQNLSKQAQELYDREKEMVERHELFMEAGHEFMNWLRLAKEKLARCSEPTGDKESLASKISQLRVLEAELPEGEKKLEAALRTAADACAIALEDDKDIVEEEVALLQDEYDQFSERMSKVKSVLEGGIVRWTDYQELHQEAIDYLNKTQETVQGYNKFQGDLQGKRTALEDFQVELQKIFDWQKDLDELNRNGQALLQTCADSRISNAVTQLTAKYQALISLAKDVMRRLEMRFQEHHQHNALYQDCQAFIDTTKEKLASCRAAENTHEAIAAKLQELKDVRQSLEHGQNKLRYVLDLKERVLLNTEPSGAQKVDSDTMALKDDFDRLMIEFQDVKTNLSNRFDLLGDIDKSNKLLVEWIEEAESKAEYDDGVLHNTLGEKRAHLEKNKAIARDLEAHKATVERLQQKLIDHPNIPNQGFSDSILRFGKLTEKVATNVEALEKFVATHEDYKDAYDKAADWIKRAKIELQRCGDTHGERTEAEKKRDTVGRLLETFAGGDDLLRLVASKSAETLKTTGEEGRDLIKQSDHQLKYDFDQAKNQVLSLSKLESLNIACIAYMPRVMSNFFFRRQEWPRSNWTSAWPLGWTLIPVPPPPIPG